MGIDALEKVKAETLPARRHAHVHTLMRECVRARTHTLIQINRIVLLYCHSNLGLFLVLAVISIRAPSVDSEKLSRKMNVCRRFSGAPMLKQKRFRLTFSMLFYH